MTDFIKEYADYMGKTKEDVEDYIQHLRTDTYNVLSYSYGKDSGACIYACEQLGIPIHEMITADVWATDDIPADLPPMVEFKDKADKIIKDRYEIDVKHVCAMTTEEKKYNPNFMIPLVSGGGTNAHTKISCTEECNQNEQNNETENTNNTTSATDHKDKNTSTDSLADRNLGAIHISKSMCLKNCKLTYQDLFYRTSNGKIARGGYRGFPTQKSNYCTSELKQSNLRISNKKLSVLHRGTQKGSVTTDFQYQSTEEIGVHHSKQKGFQIAPRNKVRI